MSTPDEIASNDWDRVHELSLELIGARTDQELEVRRNALISYLDTLERQYGFLPSIIGTRADFIDDVATKEWLLLRACALAEERADHDNLLCVNHSLAELYIEERLDILKGRERLAHLERLLNEVYDSYFAEEHARLSSLIEQMVED